MLVICPDMLWNVCVWREDCLSHPGSVVKIMSKVRDHSETGLQVAVPGCHEYLADSARPRNVSILDCEDDVDPVGDVQCSQQRDYRFTAAGIK